MKYALLIQGPMISTGITGRYQGAIREAQPRDIRMYDCTSTIIANATAGKILFDVVVFSGWDIDKDKVQLFSDTLQLDRVVLSEAPANEKTLKPRNTRLGEEHSQAKTNNMQRQFKSTLAGLLATQELGATHVVKIRTDQLVDIPKLFVELKLLCESKYSLFVPNQDSIRPWALADFYIGGSTNYLVNYFEDLAHPPRNMILSQNVHDNLFFTLALKERQNINNLSRRICLVDFFDFNQTHINASRYLWTEVVHTFSKELYFNTIWRGERVEHSAERLKFGRNVLIPSVLQRKKKPRRLRIYGNLHWLKFFLHLSGR